MAMEHRLGVCPVGEASVAIAVSSPHRREALEAAHFAIDAIKANVPIWKKVEADGAHVAFLNMYSFGHVTPRITHTHTHQEFYGDGSEHRESAADRTAEPGLWKANSEWSGGERGISVADV